MSSNLCQSVAHRGTATQLRRELFLGGDLAIHGEKLGIKSKKDMEEVLESLTEVTKCQVASTWKKQPLHFLLDLLEMKAYADNCSVENKIKEVLIEGHDLVKTLTPKKLSRYLENVAELPRSQLISDMKAIGLELKGNNPDRPFLEFIRKGDVQEKVRAKIHPPDGVTLTNHLHIYDTSGNSLNKFLKVVSHKSKDAHIEIE